MENYDALVKDLTNNMYAKEGKEKKEPTPRAGVDLQYLTWNFDKHETEPLMFSYSI